MIPYLHPHDPFPPLHTALQEEYNGLLAVGADLSPERLLSAYQQAIFPWFNEDQPILWFAPDPRMVLFPQEFKCSRSLSKKIKKTDYEIRVNTSFRAVMEACATVPRAGQKGTWIHSEMIEAYCQLHHLGYAYSVETWQQEQLIGGLYGLRLGGVFFGESMFSRVPDASKLAFAFLVQKLVPIWGIHIIDCQVYTPHLASLGAKLVPLTILTQHIQANLIKNESDLV